MDNAMPHTITTPATINGATLWIAPDAEAMLARASLRSPDDFYAITGSDLTKASLPSWRQRIRLQLTDDQGHPRAAFLKRFNRPPLAIQLKRLAQTRKAVTHAAIEARWINAIQAAGIPVPRVLALTQKRTGPWEVRSAILLDTVPGQSLEQLVATNPAAIPPETALHLADLLRRFHAAGFIHRDLYLSHVFLDTDDPTGAALNLIDLQRVLHRPLRRLRWIARDLAQLHFSTPPEIATRRERLRFMKRYLAPARLSAPASRQLLRKIDRRADQFTRKAQRRANSP